MIILLLKIFQYIYGLCFFNNLFPTLFFLTSEMRVSLIGIKSKLRFVSSLQCFTFMCEVTFSLKRKKCDVTLQSQFSEIKNNIFDLQFCHSCTCKIPMRDDKSYTSYERQKNRIIKKQKKCSVSIELQTPEYKFGRTRNAVGIRASRQVFPHYFPVLPIFHKCF